MLGQREQPPRVWVSGFCVWKTSSRACSWDPAPFFIWELGILLPGPGCAHLPAAARHSLCCASGSGIIQLLLCSSLGCAGRVCVEIRAGSCPWGSQIRVWSTRPLLERQLLPLSRVSEEPVHLFPWQGLHSWGYLSLCGICRKAGDPDAEREVENNPKRAGKGISCSICTFHLRACTTGSWQSANLG